MKLKNRLLLPFVLLLFASSIVPVLSESIPQDKELIERQDKTREELPQIRREINNLLDEKPSTDISLYLVQSVRFAGKDPRAIDIYKDVISKCTDFNSLHTAVLYLVSYGDDYNSQKLVFPVLKELLSHNNIDIRLLAAIELFKWNHKKEVYSVYKDIIIKEENDLEKIENRPILEKMKMQIKSELYKNNKEYREKVDTSIELWRIDPIIKSIDMLMQYDDPQTKLMLKKAKQENPKIMKVLKKSDEVSSKLKSNNKVSKLKIFENYINGEKK